MPRILPHLLLTSATLILSAGPGHAAEFRPGDANQDGHVRVDDAVAVLRRSILLPAPPINVYNADTDPTRENGVMGDGNLKVGDAVATLRLAVGLTDLSGYNGVDKPLLKPVFWFNVSLPGGPFGIADLIPITVDLKNNGDSVYTYRAATGCPVDVTTTDAGGFVSWISLQCDSVEQEQTLQPGEQKKWTFDWSPNPTRAISRRAGAFTVQAELDGLQASASAAFRNERYAYLGDNSLKLSDPPWAALQAGFLAEITGETPDPSWQFDRTEIEVVGETVYLYPVLEGRGGGSVDHPVPFTTPPIAVRGEGILYGKTYTVIVVGHDRNVTGTYKT